MKSPHLPGGYAGNILFIDLTHRNYCKEKLDTGLIEKFVGGPGIGFNFLHKLLQPHVDPHSAENVLIFGTGPLVGTPVPAAGKCYLVTKYSMPASPDENKYFISSSMFGSNRFGTMMKNAGYDHIIIMGRSENPCYLKIFDHEIEICDARELWGKDVYQVGEALREKYYRPNGPLWDLGNWQGRRESG